MNIIKRIISYIFVSSLMLSSVPLQADFSSQFCNKANLLQQKSKNVLVQAKIMAQQVKHKIANKRLTQTELMGLFVGGYMLFCFSNLLFKMQVPFTHKKFHEAIIVRDMSTINDYLDNGRIDPNGYLYSNRIIYHVLDNPGAVEKLLAAGADPRKSISSLHPDCSILKREASHCEHDSFRDQKVLNMFKQKAKELTEKEKKPIAYNNTVWLRYAAKENKFPLDLDVIKHEIYPRVYKSLVQEEMEKLS